MIRSLVALTPARGADFSELTATARVVASRLRRGQLVVLTGSVPPGTTRGVLLPLLSSAGLAPGSDFFLAYITNPSAGSRVVGGFDVPSTRAAAELFARTGCGVTPVSSLEAAEVCGTLGAAARARQAAAANELRVACARMGLDAWDVCPCWNRRARTRCGCPTRA